MVVVDHATSETRRLEQDSAGVVGSAPRRRWIGRRRSGRFRWHDIPTALRGRVPPVEEI